MKADAALPVLFVLAGGCAKEPPSRTPSPERRTETPAQPAAAPEAKKPAPTPEPAVVAEPAKIRVQHCLIAFAGKLPGKPVTRTQEEAKQLAYEILERARKGEDFDALVKKYTDDAHPGIYGMTNRGKPGEPGTYPRDEMVPAFGDVGFPLKVGEVGIADFDPARSPYGWHVVKRIE